MSDFWNLVPFPKDWVHIDKNMPQDRHPAADGINYTEIEKPSRYSMLHLKSGKGSTTSQVVADQGNAVHHVSLGERYLADCIEMDNCRGTVRNVPAEISRVKGHVPLPKPEFLRAKNTAASLLVVLFLDPFFLP